MTDTGPTRPVRRLVLERADQKCERCLCRPATNIHHRKPRGMGGTSDPLANAPANLLALCGSGTVGCHGWIESHRNSALTRGLLLRQAEDPLAVPFTDAYGYRWWLDNDGVKWMDPADQLRLVGEGPSGWF